ncbi:putative MFS transporter, AGZA family, xanthine/uracil permease [Paenibacillus barengoltzii J12]|jgi:AGZA family xanthine/uracil permease-like MFS transporter|uniref:MFS transporter, AGZA family, xanthine/uracil permease n=2 Tax=Paenibacillus barengoltzii TaxID=343517 RepID=A0ABY1LWV6_9BACL|nr:putative MFS transporter, AGZA family, xanthine/uracil permease [Paenibacillus barengoltzii J12]
MHIPRLMRVGEGYFESVIFIMKGVFKLKQHQTNVRRELIAGLTSFFSIVYIIAVNANILKDAGIPLEAGILATVLSSLVGCLLVAFVANAPLILVPGMGINALFTYTIVGSMGLSYQEALGATVLAGILFVVVAFTGLSSLISKAIPASLKESISVGIGLFIAFIGLQKSGIVTGNPSHFVALGDLSAPLVLASIINLILTLFLFLKKVPGNFLISIILGTLVAWLFGIVDLGSFASASLSFQSYRDVWMSADLRHMASIPFLTACFSLVLVLVFENIGLVHSQVDGMLKAPEKNGKSLKAVSISAVACGILGTSPTVSTVETAAGITAGGRTGLTSVTTGLLFLGALFFMPLIKMIPDAAIAPILIIIGGLMLTNITKIDFSDFSEAFPAFLVILMIPLTYSIVDGIAFGFIAYPLLKMFSKKREQLSISMFVISFLFLVNFLLQSVL